MFNFIKIPFRQRKASPPAKFLRRAPKQLEEVRELTKEQRDQVAAFLQSPTGLLLIERGRAIEFRDYKTKLQPEHRATWSDCLDWIISLSHVPRDTGNELDTNATEAIEGESQFRDRVSP